MFGVLLAAGMVPVVAAQEAASEEEPLLPTWISETDIEVAGRYVRQWKRDDGTLVLLFQGSFQLDAGRRRMSAEDAVVWITQGRVESDPRPFFDLTVYLWHNAEVRESAGTTLHDDVLLVTNLRTYGRVLKSHDAHSPESVEDSPLYQQALRDRMALEALRGEPPPDEAEMKVERPTDVLARIESEKPPTVIRYRADLEPVLTPAGERVIVARGRVYFSQSGDDQSALVEIQADSAVVFPTSPDQKPGEQAIPASQPAGEQPAAAATDEPSAAEAAQGRQAASQPASQPDGGLRAALLERIAGVYLEGDVILSAGPRFIRADRLYYDFQHRRALILDAVLRAQIPGREVPLYLRAAEIRQLSATEFRADHARISTSEFFTPHYHVGAERVYLRDRTQRDASGRQLSPLRGQFEVYDATLNVENTPVLWWPHSKGDVEATETSLKRFQTGYSDDFGYTLRTVWNFFALAGVETPPGFDADLKLDYFSERGPGVGLNMDYERPDAFGFLRSYAMYDDGQDNLGRFRNTTPDETERGRVTWRHRQFLPQDWQATFEVSYLSDSGWLEEYENAEFNEGKEQETAFYLKRARDTEAFSMLVNGRLLDFYTQTEHLPDLTYRRIGDTLFDSLVSYHESRAGVVRYRPDDRQFFRLHRRDNLNETSAIFRQDSRQEFELPLKLDALNVSPFVSLRSTYWSKIPRHDSFWRGLMTYGLRGGTMLSRVYPSAVSELLDINRIRHIIRPEFALWSGHGNQDSATLPPFDEGIETVDDIYGGAVALRQTWQTKRGVGDKQRTVDLLSLDLSSGFFGRQQEGEISNGYANPLRPEDSRTRNYAALDLTYRISDTTSLLYEANYDWNDGQLDRNNISIAIERLPRLAYVLGFRNAADIDMHLIGGGFNYKLTEKHIIAVREWYDLDQGRNGEFAIGYIRKLPRWYFAVNLEIDRIEDDYSLTVSLWPEGIPEWTLGSRRFTGVATSTGIRP
ncbi:MAG: LPS-assembly protein LptD [Phycisphaerae bacterium]|nr:LPS-assembly protein LptD [Phycisphaerae bacterium]